jgi:hypothetical protein
MTMSRQEAERSRQEFRKGPVVLGTASPQPGQAAQSTTTADGSTVIRPRNARQPDTPAAPPEPVMVRIMQNDGTMKMEERVGSSRPIDSSSGFGRSKRGSTVMGKQNPLIYATDEEKTAKK